MAKILVEGCVATCDFCTTKFSFDPIEVVNEPVHVPAGYSPEEEAYTRPSFMVSCPKCRRATNVEKYLGPAAKKEIANRPIDDTPDL